MFGSRRHRAPNPPLTAATADPNATTAAAAVFKRHESTASLSAAAAAAALRARPATPTRVEDVQTKRNLRRSASVASTRTASGQTRDQSGLQRRGSSGSMTERTFRTPSPHRPGSSGSGHHRSLSYNVKDDMPPVPSLPKNMDTAQIRKANSLHMGASPVRLASQKLASRDAPSWFGAAKVGDLGSIRRTDPAMASPPSSPLQLAHEEVPSDGARPDSQASSINFSYPARTRRGSANLAPIPGTSATTQTSTRTNQAQPVVEERQAGQTSRVKQQPRGQGAAPTARSQNTASQELVYDPNSRRMVRQVDLLPVNQALPHASQQRTGSTKKKQRPQRAGSHLAAGTMGRNKSGPSYAAPLETRPPEALSQTQPERQVQPTQTIEAGPVHDTRVSAEESVVNATISPPRIDAKRVVQKQSQSSTESARIPAPDAAQYAVRRQPSVVREESEAEDAEDERKGQNVMWDALDAVPGRRRVHEELADETDPPEHPPQEGIVSSKRSPGSPAKARAHLRLNTSFVDVSEDGESKPGSVAQLVSRERPQSSSPARQAHFGPVQDNLTVKHSPPPRSVSPRKSALKQISPTRGTSPSGDSSEASGSANQDPSVGRKKSVRVSFEDGATETVGDPAPTNQNGSPVVSGPLHANRHSWFTSLGRSPRDLPPLDDDDGMMKPRPTLPSFGSVRNRKPRDSSPDQSERPLVRPKAEMRYNSLLLPSPPLGSSNDHAIGPILANGDAKMQQNSRHVEATSRHVEPLPPVVTSVEGTGYFSDSSDVSSLLSSEFEHLGDEHSEAPLPSTAPGPEPDSTAGLPAAAPEVPAGRSVRAGHETLSPRITKEQEQFESEIPTISVSRPTPVGEEDRSPLEAVIAVPGGFPGDDSGHSPTSARVEDAQIPIVAKAAEATSTDTRLAQPAVQAAQLTTAEDSSDSENSIYSDAYEDLSEISGDGFQSLDAVVESPLKQDARAAMQTEHPRKQVSSPRPAEETPKLQTEISSATTVVGSPDAEAPEDEWEKIKAYWKSLTAEKRMQLEREAREEAGIDADLEGVKSEARPKKKKSIERRNSERKALAAHISQHMAQQSVAQPEKEKLANPERRYVIKPGERWTGEDSEIPVMRKTMRGEPERITVTPTHGSRLRKSMRAAGSGTRAYEPQMATSQAASKRTVSSPPPAVTPTATARHRRSATQVESDFQPPLERRDSTGSVSSFKRSRAAKAQGFGFRQSMRPMSPPSTQSDRRSSKTFSLRTMSPVAGPGRAEPAVANSSMNNPMRTTLRGSSTRRKSPTGIRMPFGLSYGGGKKSSKSGGSRFSSRFADSSDEEGGGNISSGFRSRFEDSSDDEAVLPIPAALQKTTTAASAASAGHSLRKEASLASTALPEEVEESEGSQDPRAVPTGTASLAAGTFPAAAEDAITVRRTRSGRGQLRPSSQITPASPSQTADKANKDGRTSRRSSFMAALRHRKKDNATAKIGRPVVTESAARRDTRLERSVGQLERIRSQRAAGNGGEEEEGEGEGGVDETAVPVAVPVARSPRLQKRVSKKVPPSDMGTGTHTVAGGTDEGNAANGVLIDAPQQEVESGFFPLAQHRRSSTSGNLGTRTLSGGSIPLYLQSHRRMSSLGMEATSMGGSVAGSMAGASSTTRKKRFGSLRRMFGLND